MPSSRRAEVSTVGEMGRADSHPPESINPDPTPRTPEVTNFEAADFAAVAGGPGNANVGHPGHGKNSGGPSFAAQAAARGHREVNPTVVTGHGVAKRGPGMKTPATTIDKGLD